MSSSYLISNLIYLAVINVITNRGLVFGLRIGSKFQHNLEELEATKIVEIQPNKCQNNMTQVFVHSAATTQGKYFERRKATRETWGRDAKYHNLRVTFVLGQPRDIQTQRQILSESERFGDILQFGFIDDYHNLTLKAIAILGWASLNCLVGDYIVKTDDDIVVNTKRLRYNIDKRVFPSGLTGKLFTNSKPIRDIEDEYADKWLVPKEIYDKEVYPPYLSGSAYVMSIDVIQRLYISSTNNSDPILDIDDLYMTGFVTKKFNIEVHDSPEFYLTGSVDKLFCGIDVCKMYYISTLHGCYSVNHTLDLWNSWKNSTFDSCKNFFNDSPKTTKLGKISFIIAIVLLIVFILSIVSMICQYFTKQNVHKWQKVNH